MKHPDHYLLIPAALLVGLLVGLWLSPSRIVITPGLPERGACSAPDQAGYSICNISSESRCAPALRMWR